MLAEDHLFKYAQTGLARARGYFEGAEMPLVTHVVAVHPFADEHKDSK